MLEETFDKNLPMAEELLKIMNQKNATLATAESCTGGILATLFTYFEGSSQVYLGGVSSYSNDSKINILGVNQDTIENYGAVSRETAAQMAEGAQKKFGSDFSIAITCIAGPRGATESKPVGTIWCGYATPGDLFTKEYHLDGDRNQIRNAIIGHAIKDLKTYIIEAL